MCASTWYISWYVLVCTGMYHVLLFFIFTVYTSMYFIKDHTFFMLWGSILMFEYHFIHLLSTEYHILESKVIKHSPGIRRGWLAMVYTRYDNLCNIPDIYRYIPGKWPLMLYVWKLYWNILVYVWFILSESFGHIYGKNQAYGTELYVWYMPIIYSVPYAHQQT